MTNRSARASSAFFDTLLATGAVARRPLPEGQAHWAPGLLDLVLDLVPCFVKTGGAIHGHQLHAHAQSSVLGCLSALRETANKKACLARQITPARRWRRFAKREL